MTVSSETSRVSYSGNAITTAFSTTFRFLAAADLEVILVDDTTGVETAQVLTTDYTVAGVGDSPSGTVTMIVAPATGETLVIVRDPAFTQLLDYIENGPFPAESHERGLDLLTYLCQRLLDLSDRSMRLADGDTTGASTELPIFLASKLLGISSDGLSIVLEDQAVGGVVADGSITNAKMADDSIGTDELIDDNVTQAKMATNSVGTDELIDLSTTEGKLSTAVAAKLNLNALASKVVDMPTWDMDATAKVNIAHGLTKEKIRSVNAIVVGNTGNTYPINTSNEGGASGASVAPQGGIGDLGTTTISVERLTGGFFDGVGFNAATGWVTIWYEPS